MGDLKSRTFGVVLGGSVGSGRGASIVRAVVGTVVKVAVGVRFTPPEMVRITGTLMRELTIPELGLV